MQPATAERTKEQSPNPPRTEGVENKANAIDETPGHRPGAVLLLAKHGESS
jgi:hypothetical protein